MKLQELFIVDKIRQRALRGARASRLGLRLGIGDDAAVLAGWKAGQELLITTDLVVEGSHFEARKHPARALGHKALARGLSDIAAMGGRPLYALLSLCVPPWAGRKWQKQFFDGLFGLARRSGVTLVGGDLAAGDRLAADIVVVGAAPRGRTLERSQAKTGDIVYVSGHLGGSALGFDRLRRGRAAPRDPAVRRHLYPTPRLALGRFLARTLRARAGMDLSDGLSLDLYRLTRESHVGAEVWSHRIPVFPGATVNQALHGGEDYELLFTLDPGRKPPSRFQGVPITAVGVVVSGRRITLVGPDGTRVALPIKGFQHLTSGARD